MRYFYSLRLLYQRPMVVLRIFWDKVFNDRFTHFLIVLIFFIFWIIVINTSVKETDTPDHPPVTSTCIGADVMFRCCYVVLTYKTSLPPVGVMTWERKDEPVKSSRRQLITTKYQKLETDTTFQSLLIQSYKIDSTLDIYGVKPKDLGRYKCYVVGSKSFIPLISSSCEAMSRDPRQTCECDVTGDFYHYTATEKKIAAIFRKGVTVSSISEFDLDCGIIDQKKWIFEFLLILMFILIVAVPFIIYLQSYLYRIYKEQRPYLANIDSYLTTKYHVFLSYNEYNYDFVNDEIVPFLNEFNINYFDKQFDIIPGRHKLHEIGEAIGRSEAFIVVASHQFVNDFEQNTFEMNMLLNKATNSNLVILRIDDCVIDDVFNCYEVIDWTRTGDRMEAANQLQEWVERYLQGCRLPTRIVFTSDDKGSPFHSWCITSVLVYLIYELFFTDKLLFIMIVLIFCNDNIREGLLARLL